MESSIKKRLIIRPLVLTALMLIVAVFIIWFVPHQLSKAISLIGNSEQQVSFPPIFAVMVVLALIAKPLSVLISNLILLANWKEGTNPSCPTCSYPMVKRLDRKSELQSRGHL